MSFLNPFMLLGIGAVSVPIIIHLLNRRRFQKVVWGAMRFLKVSVEQNQRRMRVEDLILLLLRCLLLVLLALALARPAILSSGADMFGQSKVTAVIVLDNSYSMGASDGAETRFEKGKAVAAQVLDSMPAGSATALLLASDVVAGSIPEPTFDLNLARKLVREAPLTDRSTDLYPAVKRAVEILKDRLVIRKEVYVITDGQAGGWRQMDELRRTLAESKSEVATHIVLIQDGETRNLGVSDLRLAGGLSPANQPIRFEVKVTNFGDEEARNVAVSLSLDGEAAGDEFAIESIAAGSSKSISLFTKLRRAGYHSVTARIPEDRLHADDARTLAVRAIREVRVLLVDGEQGNEARDAETFFLGHALVPVAREYVQDYFIRAETMTSAELSGAQLEDYDAVVLANVSDFSDATLSHLKSYLRRGGGLIVFPGSRVNTVFYNEQLFKQSKILPAALGPPRGDPEQVDTFVTFQAKDYVHPVVELWNDSGAGTLASARFYRRFELVPDREPVVTVEAGNESEGLEVEEAGRPRTVLNYSDGSVAVMERNWGLGRVVMFSSGADTDWNDLPVRLSFVPLMHRILGLIVQRQDEGLNVRVGERFSRRVQMEYLDRDATYFKPRQTDAIRDLRRIELVDGWPVLVYDGTDFAGLYDVSVAKPALDLKFAAQSDPFESNLEEMSPGQLATLKEAANVIQWGPRVSLRGMVERQRSGMEFWLPVVLAALLIAALETFLAQWFSRSK